MQLEQIDTFLDLCETRSFHQTAERLSITQSTVSARVKALEAAVGARLFKRSRAGTALTTEGLRFEPHARGLRHNWQTALNATKDVALGGVTMRIGLQHDLVGMGIRDLIADLRQTFPDTAFLLESDYSTQMCNDLVSGSQDIAVLYSPKLLPDLHFEPLGEVRYVMVSTVAATVSEIVPDSYILGNYAPAFSQMHAALFPQLSQVPLSIGQNAGMVALLGSFSGTAYVLESSAAELVADGGYKRVSDAPVIAQPLFAGLNARNRSRTSFRRMVAIFKRQFLGRAPSGATPARSVGK
jgi:DNA-binding transcriptional LysR family regulator